MRIGVLSNLTAGRSPTHILRMLSFLKDRPDILHVETEGHDHVPEALAVLARQETDVLVVNGGDGTLQRALTAILGDRVFERPPLIAPLRGGRTNMSARDISSQRSPLAALSVLIETARNGATCEQIVERPVLRIDLGPDAALQYGMFFGVGVIYRTIELKHRLLPDKYLQGIWTSGAFLGALIIRAMWGAANGLLMPDSLEICLDGQPLERQPFHLAMATTLERLFLKIQPFWGQEVAPIRFTAIASRARRTLMTPMRILTGHPPPSSTLEAGYTSRNVQRAELRLDYGFTVDGELFAPQPGRSVRLEADQRICFVRT